MLFAFLTSMVLILLLSWLVAVLSFSIVLYRRHQSSEKKSSTSLCHA
jgi:heme/copper-type cytochrome/quinol oxidase subunit 2